MRWALVLGLWAGAAAAQTTCEFWQAPPEAAERVAIRIHGVLTLEPGRYRGTVVLPPRVEPGTLVVLGPVPFGQFRYSDGRDYVVAGQGALRFVTDGGREVAFRLGILDLPAGPASPADLVCVLEPGFPTLLTPPVAAGLSDLRPGAASLAGLAEEAGKPGPRRLADLAPEVGAKIPPRACLLPDFTPVPLAGLTVDTGLAVAGWRTGRGPLSSMAWDPASGAVVEDGLSVALAPGGIELLTVPPVAGPPLARPTDPAALAPGLDILIAGSARMLAISGLEALDAALPLDRLHPVWLPVTRAATLAAPVEADSFSALVALARSRDDEPPPLSQPGVLAGLLRHLTEALLARTRPVGQVVLVLEAAQYPADTPLAMQRALARIGAEAPLLRFPVAGAPPRRWLFVLTPRFVQDFARGYLEGPVLTAQPPAGAFMAEPERETVPRRLLADPRVLAGAILANLAASTPEGAMRLLPLDAGWGELALLVPAAELFDLLGAVRVTEAALDGRPADFTALRHDPPALLALQTDAAGVPVGAAGPPDRTRPAGETATLHAGLSRLGALLEAANRRSAGFPDCTHLLAPAALWREPHEDRPARD